MKKKKCKDCRMQFTGEVLTSIPSQSVYRCIDCNHKINIPDITFENPIIKESELRR